MKLKTLGTGGFPYRLWTHWIDVRSGQCILNKKRKIVRKDVERFEKAVNMKSKFPYSF